MAVKWVNSRRQHDFRVGDDDKFELYYVGMLTTSVNGWQLDGSAVANSRTTEFVMMTCLNTTTLSLVSVLELIIALIAQCQ